MHGICSENGDKDLLRLCLCGPVGFYWNGRNNWPIFLSINCSDVCVGGSNCSLIKLDSIVLALSLYFCPPWTFWLPYPGNKSKWIGDTVYLVLMRKTLSLFDKKVLLCFVFYISQNFSFAQLFFLTNLKVAWAIHRLLHSCLHYIGHFLIIFSQPILKSGPKLKKLNDHFSKYSQYSKLIE